MNRIGSFGVPMSIEVYLVSGAVIWFLLAAWIGPTEQKRQSKIADPY
jgi:hypothetical protein